MYTSDPDLDPVFVDPIKLTVNQGGVRAELFSLITTI